MSKRTIHEDKYIKSNRTFPVGNTILLVLAIGIQITLLIWGFTYQPVPKDLIHQYDVTVEPLADGSLDITYHLVWEALDTSETLTWVEIGMANENYTVYSDTVSSNIESYSQYSDDGYVTLQLDFKQAYIGGDMIDFSFKINQKDMLCRNDRGYYFEFVPGWFNEIRVEQYTFTWRMPNGKDYTLRGSLDYGEYDTFYMQYGVNDFDGCKVVSYYPFEGGCAYNGLDSARNMTRVVCCAIVAALLLAEVFIIDSYVSYGRGRGFLTGYGYHVHTYGRPNPYYIRARDKHMAKHGSGGRSGGCACACACACAGGGRAGCSQKDMFGVNREP